MNCVEYKMQVSFKKKKHYKTSNGITLRYTRKCVKNVYQLRTLKCCKNYVIEMTTHQII